MQDLNDLYYFVKVVEYGGFSAASHELMTTKSLLSRRIAVLEKRLEVQLLNRNTRQVTVTDAGQVYYRHCLAMLAEAQAADEAIHVLSAEPCGTVKISCPTNLLQVTLGEMLSEFLILYPKVKLHIEATNKKVDLVHQSYDIAVRVRTIPLDDCDLIVRSLATSRQFLVASPQLIQESHGLSLRSLKDLQDWPILMMESIAPEYSWDLFDTLGQSYQFKCTPRLTTTDLEALRIATIKGLGISKLPELMVADDLSTGKLVKVIPDWEPKPELIHLVYTSRRGLLPAVKLLIEFLVLKFQELKLLKNYLY
ncbi:LysR substrate-binding domain-containing protein [Acinetobacter piscicola]|uniref:LysR substrate-binding domain-containing protein n=1 Tax=Acinetobacter piscicola TaxID=2006115 RepID=UPI000B7EAE77|nr:LysR substrate-binding domain-containing protein [Acinetobacter piscicola]